MSDDVLREFEALIDEAETPRLQLEQELDQAKRIAKKTSAPAGDPGVKAAQEALAAISPWTRNDGGELIYSPNMPLLVKLLTGPKADKASTQSGRLAKGFDAWLAYELRRAKFHPAEVWPRNRAPRVFSKELEGVASRLDRLADWLARQDAQADAAALKEELKGDMLAVMAADQRLVGLNARETATHQRKVASYERAKAKAEKDNKQLPEPVAPLELTTDRVPVTHNLMPNLREVLNGAINSLPGTNATNILGRFYVKQVDVVVSSWDRGPDVLISGKTMFSSFGKNTKNRYEETLGEATNLRDRHPLAGMGYAFLVSDGIFNESGAYGRLQDLLIRTRKPYGPYDATMLLIATWDEASKVLEIRDPLAHPATSAQQPPVDLSAPRFFTDLLSAVILNTPVGIHDEMRTLRNGTPVPGGTPDLVADANEAALEKD